ncbi:hypothetical protein [Paralcaligenes ureilyticus]|uniref:Uncharacterized protein n=1 Tax=Paralcaligenes ureilyticus TaxID=627131 RepID=A0A4R3LJM0_9BURK|nr:hypothetical protein [Paralcaligenes ureilyticus]TCT00470.1 hypothetical protein EDC26_1322 [Paralcaligenes ureilyticus]
MEMLSLALLAVLLIAAGAVMTGLIAERLPMAVLASADEGRFAGLGGVSSASPDNHNGVTAAPSPSVI